ncbi:MAG: hypothetical protein AAB933_02675 [Patescibacteria group bacterium]
MDKKFICSNKYTISATNTIGLPVSLVDLPVEITVYGIKLFLKSSFHVSLVCINEIIRKYNVSIQDFKDSVIKDFCDFVKENDIKLLKYHNDFRFVEENDLKTIIIACKVSNLEKFFRIINKKYNLEIEYPPTHITLYILKDKLGIFLTTEDDIKNLTKPIDNPFGFLLQP